MSVQVLLNLLNKMPSILSLFGNTINKNNNPGALYFLLEIYIFHMTLKLL